MTRPTTAAAMSSARALMTLSKRVCRARALRGVWWAMAAAVSAWLIGAATRR